jgi:hypothetical protein
MTAVMKFPAVSIERPDGVEVSLSGVVIQHPKFILARKSAGAEEYEELDRGASLSEIWHALYLLSGKGIISGEVRDYTVLALARTDTSDVLIRCEDGTLFNAVREQVEYSPRSRRSSAS